MIELHRTLAMLISPIVIGLGIFILFQTKRNYQEIQCRSRATSAACLFYHEIYVGITVYSAYFSTWPFFKENILINLHLFFFSLGSFICLIAMFIYIFYMFNMESFLRAIGRTPDKLITEGIFNRSRNPQSLARAIGLISLGIWGRSFHALFLAIIWISLNHPYILIEEKFLERRFGEDYMKYCTTTPRYCGILNPLKRIRIINGFLENKF
jgi:protein-S-isoprenylcysteine O-methyltransferase Ste14